ncbi:MAG: hypothetical protein M1827_003533 [Pycnora praestabilis]|nr:MAG: hypothetical protein M1827_003533 [Pycnora praestabilis]
MAPQSRGKKSNRTPVSHSLSTPNFPTYTARESATDPASQLSSGETYPPTHDLTSPEAPSSGGEDDDADFQSHYSLVTSSSSSSSDTEENATPISNDDHRRPAQRPLLRHSNSSFLGHNAFAPPYYNRPPTPLPASPSLTSLLRPPFSTTTSRPSTPDSSDNETPNDTEAVVAKSARIATTVPRASPKVPTYEYYGFVLYLLSSLAFLMYLLWSYLPRPFLHQLGIYYYPNRWWSLAIPSSLVMTIIYIYVALASYNTEYLTLPMSSIENMVDEAANLALIDRNGKIIKGGSEGKRGVTAVGYGSTEIGNIESETVDWNALWSAGTDAVMDVPVGGVCEILYGDGRDDIL